ncbi:MAG: M20 family metallo-hydrolase [Calditrichaceae bacterium]|nr:M20 family metallo-hydrolase [Calditrichaceae bacterium]
MSSIEQVMQKISELENNAVELMKSIVPIKALGPLNNGEGETAKAEYIIKYLKSIGLSDIREYPAGDKTVPGGKRPNMTAILDGENKNRTVWILAHLDVVPEGDRSKWDTDPFEAVVKDGKIYGRGTEDNNQGLVSGIIAAQAFLDLGIKPKYNLGLMLVSDEETGSIFGLQHMVKNHKELFKKDDLIVVPDAGEPDSSMIEVAEKSILWLKFKTVGKQVHASTPEKGINAFKAASHLVVELNKLHTMFDTKDEVFDPPISTFEATKKEANVPNVNTIPGEDVFYLDCRILPNYTIQQVMDEAGKMCRDIEKKFDVKIEISIAQKDEAAPPTPVDAPVVKALEKAIKHVYKVDAKPMGIGGGTVAAIFRRAGYHAAVWSTLDDLAHQPNEYCVISNMMNDAKVFAHVCLNG